MCCYTFRNFLVIVHAGLGVNVWLQWLYMAIAIFIYSTSPAPVMPHSTALGRGKGSTVAFLVNLRHPVGDPNCLASGQLRCPVRFRSSFLYSVFVVGNIGII